MLSFLPDQLKGFFASLLTVIHTVFWCSLIFILIPFKLFIPFQKSRHAVTKVMIAIAQNWISCNSAEIQLVQKSKWDVKGLEGLSSDRSYLVCANHQSWVDIIVLQTVFNRRIPFLRFFLKRELMYVPFLGVAWWALDFPFMKRYSKSYLAKHPEKRGKDMETTRRACAKFKGTRISILNFLEGTRITPEKHARQKSEFKNLLPPKTGGLAFVLEAMGEQFDALLDVTIVYSDEKSSLWDLFSGRVKNLTVRIERIEIPKNLLGGNYLEDTVFRERTQAWVRDIWKRKDLTIDSLTPAN